MNPFSGERSVGRRVELVFSEAAMPGLDGSRWTATVSSVGEGGVERVERFVVLQLDRPIRVFSKEHSRLAITRRFGGLLPRLLLLELRTLNVNVYDAEVFAPGMGLGGIGIGEVRWA